MHEWERQDKLLEKVENEKIDDCLKFKKFTYQKQEWDNIPGIVPRYVIYLSKYIEGLCSFCDDVNSRETVDSLRTDMEGRLLRADQEFGKFKVKDIQDKAAINSTLELHQRVADEFRSTYNTFTHEATKLAELECTDCFDSCMELVLETKGNMDEDDDKNAVFKKERH